MDDTNATPSTSGQALTAELRDGQLQIVEVSKVNKSEDDIGETIELQTSEGTKYMQVLDANGKGLMQLDLLNLTLVRCEDGEDGYRLISNADSGEGGTEFMGDDSTTVTCVLQSSDGEDQEARGSYVMVEEQQDDPDMRQSYVMVQAEEGGRELDEQESYVMVEGAEGPVVYLQSDWKNNKIVKMPDKQKNETTLEILERAQALHKAKKLLRESMRPARGRGRRPRHLAAEPQDLLSSPAFKLFLYSCKMCTFKCNAIRDLTTHRKAAHGVGSGAGLRGGRVASSTLQCARCPYRGTTHYQLMRHVQDNHMEKSKEEEIAVVSEVLVCGGCGFESTSRKVFKDHIHEKHPKLQMDDDDS